MEIELEQRKSLSKLGAMASTLLILLSLSACTLLAGDVKSPPMVEDPWGVVTIPGKTKAKIVVVSANTGPYSGLGQGIVNSAKMAILEHRSPAGLSFELDIQDSMCQADRGLLIARSFVRRGGYVGVVGDMCAEPTKAAIPVYTKENMALIVPASTAPQITASNSPIVFRTSWNDLVQVKPAADYAYSTLGLKNAAIINDTTPYGSALAEEFQRVYSDMGGSIALSQNVRFTGGAQEGMQELIGAIISSRSSLIYFAGVGENGATLIKTLRAAGVKTAFMGPDSMSSKSGFIDPAGSLAEGVYVTNVQLPSGEAYVQWKPNYEKRFQTGVRESGFERQSYDAAMVLMQAVEKVAVKQLDGSFVIGKHALVDAIRSTGYDGISGKISFNANGDRSEGVKVSIGQIIKGEVKKVSG